MVTTAELLDAEATLADAESRLLGWDEPREPFARALAICALMHNPNALKSMALRVHQRYQRGYESETPEGDTETQTCRVLTQILELSLKYLEAHELGRMEISGLKALVRVDEYIPPERPLSKHAVQGTRGASVLAAILSAPAEPPSPNPS
ncbi:hypothetical protein ACPOLB_21935 [Rubrivivax sp. RP6-9]|uniref:hypothetical protein n=1 Tax=Rubrivivax sp. RP6-9 TaxID=3415750 RepID=UPI003CC50FD4